jgi:hypothetical protein
MWLNKKKKQYSKVSPISKCQDIKQIPPWQSHVREILDPYTTPVVVSLILGFLLLLVASFVYWYFVFTNSIFLSDEDNTGIADLYISLVTAIISLVTVYAITLGILAGLSQQDINATNAAITGIQTLMFTNYPHSIRLYKEMFSCDPSVQQLQDVCLNNHTCKSQGKQLMFESTASSIIFQSISNVLDIEPSPGVGWQHMWQSYFRSPIIQRQWLNKRPYFDLDTQRYVEKQLYQPCVSKPVSCAALYEPPKDVLFGTWYCCNPNLILNPATIIAAVITIIFLAGTGFYWSYAQSIWPNPSDYKDRLNVYFDACAALGVISTLLLLVYGYINTRTQTVLVNINDSGNLEKILNQNYPISVQFYKEMYKCDATVQEIPNIPLSVHQQNKRILFNSRFSISLFQLINDVLIVQNSPDEGDKNQWKSWFLSNQIKNYWRVKGLFFDIETQNYVDREFM